MARLQKRSTSLFRELSRYLSRLSEDVSQKGVHRLRTTIRRVETLIHQTGARPGKKQQRALEELRALRKRAGKVRDLDIQMGLLATIGNGSASPDRRALMEVLRKKREKHVARLASAAQELEDSKLLNRLKRISEESPVSVALAEIQEQLAGLAAGYSSSQILKPARLHTLRIRLKLLRYQAELATGTPEQKELLKEVKSVQDAIGEWHDWEMLEKSAEKHFADRLNCALLVEIRALLAARYSAAHSAAMNLLAAFSPAPKKKPSSVQAASALAQRA